MSTYLVARVQDVTSSQGLLGLRQPLLVAERELLLGLHNDPLNYRRVRSGMKPAKNRCRSHHDLTFRSSIRGLQSSQRADEFQSNRLYAVRGCQLFGVA